MNQIAELPGNLDYREVLRRAGNPFRNYFARNPDDDVCARYHVPELYASERELLHAIIDLYRYDPMAHSETVPVLGNKGAGKTHLLHSIKHESGSRKQLLVTPGTYQRDADFPEYLLFQIVETLLGGGRQNGARPLDMVGDLLVRKNLAAALRSTTAEEKVDLFPPPGIGKWGRRIGLGASQAVERSEWLADALGGRSDFGRSSLEYCLRDAGISPETAFDLLVRHAAKQERHDVAGAMRRKIHQAIARAVLLKDESEAADFLTYGFAESEFQIRPTRQDLVSGLLKVLMELFRSLKIPVVVAFDQLEDLLLARRADDAHKTAESFFAGIVQMMHKIDGVCFLIFAERGLWNRFVPSLDGYIQDRLNNPVHVPKIGTVKAIRLEAPPVHLVRRVVEARMRSVIDELPDVGRPRGVSEDIFPFTDEQVLKIAKTEPTLRDMLQQFRHLFDHLVYGDESTPPRRANADTQLPTSLDGESWTSESQMQALATPVPPPVAEARNRISELLDTPPAIPVPEPRPIVVEPPVAVSTPENLGELWDQEQRAARRKLEPEGALAGAARELQAALGSFLQTCHEHGVKVGPWRLQHVVAEWPFGDHPTYGAASLAHWSCKDGAPWRVGIGLFLARGAGKPKDLEIKLSLMEAEPQVVDYMILLRPEDDLSLAGKSKTLWNDAERRGRHARLEALSLDAFARLHSFPRWMAAIRESLPEGAPLPNLADLLQEKAEKLLEQVCMPIQG